MRSLALAAVLALATSCRHVSPSSNSGSATDSAAAEQQPIESGAPPVAPSATVPGPPIASDRSWVAQFKGSKTFGETHPFGVLAVAFLPDGVHAISSGVDGVAREWDLRTGRVVNRLTGARFKFHQIVFTRDGQRAVAASDGVAYWHVGNGDVVRELQVPEGETADAVALSHDDRRAVGGSPGKVRVWDLASGATTREFSLRGQVLAVRFTDDDRHVQIVTDLASCKAEASGDAPPDCKEFPLLRMGVIACAGAQELDVLLGTRVGELFLWDNAASSIKKRWKALPPTQEIGSIDYHADLHRAILGGSAVRVWDVAKGAPMRDGATLGKAALAVALSDDGLLALAGSEDGTVQLRKLTSP